MGSTAGRGEEVSRSNTLTGLVLLAACVLAMFTWDLAALARWKDDITARQQALLQRLQWLRGLSG